MQTKITYLSDLKFNLETWKRELRFHFNEMDTFEEKLEEIAGREFGKKATIPLEKFQNRIMLEKDAISKLMHRCKNKLKNISRADFKEQIDGRLQREQHTIAEDMRDYIRMHYDLKEDMMRYFREWL
jgi:benzoyl-CoA reductase/2-hydroxyglutaryl-CoA dehydratase subunit BcrC/BadD/HgdB